MHAAARLAASATSSAQQSSGSDDDIISGVGYEIRVGLDRWSVGQPMITNMSSGFLLQVRGALEAGDLVRTNGIRGVVDEINTRSVVIDTSNSRRVHVPNTEMVDGTIENFPAQGRRRTTVEFMVDRSVSVDTVATAVTAAVRSADHVLDVPAPRVLIDRIVGPSIVLRCDLWHDPSLEASRLVTHETAACVIAALDGLDVELGGSASVALRDCGPHTAQGLNER